MRVSSRWLLWLLPAIGSAAAAGLFGVGFWLALRGSLGTPLGEPPPPPVTPQRLVSRLARRRLLVLGDSLAKGTGDESGRGFAGDVEDFLKRRGAVDLVNLAVNGAESQDVARLLDGSNVQTLAASSDWIILSAGGNDLSHAVPRPGSPTQALENVDRARGRFLANLREILATLRRANPRAPIYVIGLYDPFEGPAAASRVGASVILSWIDASEETALSFPGTLVVPTFDLFLGRPDRLAADHFHPNRRGYDEIARRIEQLIEP